MELATHYVYCYALTKSGLYSDFNALEIGFLGYLSLHLIWLKFLIIWRYFRCWALFDEIETVENMNRCMSNNYTLQVFFSLSFLFIIFFLITAYLGILEVMASKF